MLATKETEGVKISEEYHIWPYTQTMLLVYGIGPPICRDMKHEDSWKWDMDSIKYLETVIPS